MDSEKVCKAGVIKSETLPECSNEMLIPKGHDGPVVGKIDVVLAEPVVQIDVESIIELEEPALEIKRIKKNVFITQCKVIDTGSMWEKTGKLFLSGFVRKNIEYATADCKGVYKTSTSGKILHTTVDIPFTCVTKVKFDVPPKFNQKGNTTQMASFLSTSKGHDFCGQKIMGNDPCEQSFEHTEFFNEKIFCELEEAKIFEDDILKNAKKHDCDCDDDFTFTKIIEKMVIFVRIKLLQKQQINISGHKNYCDDKKKY